MSFAKHVLLLLAGLATFLMLGSAPQAAPGKRVHLFFQSPGQFDPLLDRLRLPADLTVDAAERESPAPVGAAVSGKPRGKLGHWIVQFDGPIQEEWKTPIYNLGGLLLDYVPDYGFIVRIPQQQVRGLRNLAHVRAVQPYQPAFALSSRFPGKPVVLPITVATFTVSDVPGVTARIKQLRGIVNAYSVINGHGVIEAQVRPAVLRALARTFGVSWIEYRDRSVLHNDKSIGVGNVDDVRTNVGLYGANQIVAVLDTGLDTGNTSTVHPDFAGRVAATHVYGNQGNWSDYQSHGTHCAGTILGSGVSSGADPSAHSYPITGTPCYAGVAPEARLVMQSDLNTDGSLGGLDSITLKTILKDAYDDGARVHSNSWGAFTDGTYNYQCVTVDSFVHQLKDMVVCFSAGNSGVDTSPQDGFVDSGSHRAPGVSKNVICVGASENNRSGVNWTWGTSYGSPIGTDRIADNINGMCSFSSRGPCNDTAGAGGIRRIKPDIVAPGSLVASPRTSQAFLTENFDSTSPGSIPAGWSRSHSVIDVTSAAAYSGSNSLGFGDSSPNQGYNHTGFQAIWSGAIDTQKASSALVVGFRARWNIRSGDTVYVGRRSAGGSFLSFASNISGSTGGSWFHWTVPVPNTDDVTYGDLRTQPIFFGINAATTSLPSDGYYLEIDDVRVVPMLTTTLGILGTETPGSARDEAYMYSNGTSMACPAVAGMAALVREYYQERKNVSSPSAALVKATLITSAASMGTGQYVSPQEIPSTRPNSVNGWGRADLQKAVAPQTTSYPNTRHLFADVGTGLKTGGVDTYTVHVTAGTPLNVGLVWTDPPATNGVSVALINNLDLTVSGPSVTGNGNGVAGDDRNPTETVDFASPSSGTYTITVAGANIPTGQQPYALVIYGDVTWQDTLIVSPATATCQYGRKLQFSAMYNGRSTSGVTWSVPTGNGTIDSNGLYTAPVSGSGDTVRATYGSLTKDATVAFVAASTQATAFISINVADYTKLTGLEVGVGPNPAAPLATSGMISYTLTGNGLYNFWFNVDGLVQYLPPGTSSPWWAKVYTTGGSVGVLQDFYIVRGTRDVSGTYAGYVSSGEKFVNTNLPLTLGASSGAPYGWIDTVTPSAALTAPADGSTVGGTQSLDATASDNDRIARVDFYVDDRLIGADSSSPYSVSWDTTAESNVRHRVTVRATDMSGNTAEDFRLVTTSNGGTRPDVRFSISGWSFNSSTREMTATGTFTNNGSAAAYKISLQRVTLWCTGPTFSGYRQVYMDLSSGTLPTNITSLNAGASTTIQLRATMPPETTAIPRWSATGTYYDQASGGARFYL